VLDGATSSSWRSNQIKTSVETQFEERSKQLRDGSYPLHIAIANSAPFPVIEMMINAAPDVLSLTDKFDRTCLHVAVANGATIDSMLIVDPVTLQETSIYQPPRTTTEVLELLHSANSKQIYQQDKSKNLPIHTAMQGGCSARSKDFLIREYPQAVDAKNIDNLTPSELAFKYRKE
jgi:ankyrin repeat protein